MSINIVCIKSDSPSVLYKGYCPQLNHTNMLIGNLHGFLLQELVGVSFVGTCRGFFCTTPLLHGFALRSIFGESFFTICDFPREENKCKT